MEDRKREVRGWPGKLNCEVYYFPWPNDHVFCCKKNEHCECPRPMGVCASPEDLEEAAKEDEEEEEEEDEEKNEEEEEEEKNEKENDEEEEEEEDYYGHGEVECDDGDGDDCEYEDLFKGDGCRRKRCLRMLVKRVVK